MKKDNDPPTKEQMEMLRKIGSASGLFACEIPKTKSEAKETIDVFLHGILRRRDYRILSSEYLEVGEKLEGKDPNYGVK